MALLSAKYPSWASVRAPTSGVISVEFGISLLQKANSQHSSRGFDFDEMHVQDHQDHRGRPELKTLYFSGRQPRKFGHIVVKSTLGNS